MGLDCHNLSYLTLNSSTRFRTELIFINVWSSTWHGPSVGFKSRSGENLTENWETKEQSLINSYGMLPQLTLKILML